MGMLAFCRVSLIPVPLNICLEFLLVKFVVCWGFSTGLVCACVLCTSHIGDSHCGLCCGQVGALLRLYVIVRLGICQEFLYWSFRVFFFRFFFTGYDKDVLEFFEPG